MLPMETTRCTYCGRRADAALVEVVLRGVRYDYCDAACATAHRMAVDLTADLCPECGTDAMGDTGVCTEHLIALEPEPADVAPHLWRRAG
jgi:hypothetical protein